MAESNSQPPPAATTTAGSLASRSRPSTSTGEQLTWDSLQAPLRKLDTLLPRDLLNEISQRGAYPTAASSQGESGSCAYHDLIDTFSPSPSSPCRFIGESEE